MSTSNVPTGAPSNTAQTPPTTMNSTLWRTSTARMAEKSVAVSGIAGAEDGVHVALEDPKTLFRRLRSHPSKHCQVDSRL